MLTGFLALVATFLKAEFANVFPNLAGVFGSIVSSLLKPQATVLHKAMSFFTAKVESGSTWEDAFTATINEVGTEEYAILGEVEKSLLNAFMHKAKS